MGREEIKNNVEYVVDIPDLRVVCIDPRFENENKKISQKINEEGNRHPKEIMVSKRLVCHLVSKLI